MIFLWYKENLEHLNDAPESVKLIKPVRSHVDSVENSVSVFSLCEMITDLPE